MKKILLASTLLLVASAAFAQTTPAFSGTAGEAGNSPDAFEVTKPFIQLGHSQTIYSVAFSPDGRYAVSGSGDRTAILWDLEVGDALKTFAGIEGEISAVAFHPNGKHVLTANKGVGWTSEAIKLWDIRSGKELRTFSDYSAELDVSAGEVDVLTLSADGKRAMTDGRYGPTIVWDVEAGEILQAIEGSFNSAAISPDGNLAILAGHDGKLTLWDIARGKRIKRFRGHKEEAWAVAFSADGRYFASTGGDYKLIVWDALTRKPVRVIEGLRYDYRYLAFSPSGNHVVSRDWLDTRLWDVQTGKEKWSYPKQPSIAVSPDEKYVLTGGYDAAVRVWDLQTDEIVKVLPVRSNVSVPVAFAPDGEYAFTGGTGPAINLWDTRRGRIVRRFVGHDQRVSSIRLSADGRLLLSGSADKTLKLWDVQTGSLIRTFSGHTSGIAGVALTSDGRYAVGASYDETVRAWDLKSGELRGTLRIYEGSPAFGGIMFCHICAVDFSPDGFQVAVADDEKTTVWNLRNFKKVQTLGKTSQGLGEHSYFHSLTYAPDGRSIFAGTEFRGLQRYDVESGKQTKSYRSKEYGVKKITRDVAISPDGKTIVAANADHSAELWDTASSEKIRAFLGHSGTVASIAFSPDGKRILSGSYDGTAKIWDTQTGKELLTLAAFDDGEWVSITPDGYFDASENGAQHLKILTGPLEISSIDQYYESFYRPDIVAAAYSGAPVDKPTLKIADVLPAPGIRFTATATSIDQEQLEVTLEVTDNGGGVGQVRLYLDGVLVKSGDDRAIAVQGKATDYARFSIKVPPGEHELKAFAYNEANSMSSKAALHRVVATHSATQKPNLYLLVIGINEYDNPAISLKYAVPDAELFARTLQNRTAGLFGERKLLLLTSRQQTTKDAIRQAFQSLQDISPTDLFVFYVASHGIIDEARYHMITSNVGVLSSRGIQREALGQDELRDLIASVPSTKKVVVLDTCHSGALGASIQQALMTRGLNEVTAMKVLSRAVGSTILSASTSQQQALEGYNGHGLFTYVLAEGLNGKADHDNDGYVKTLEIANYVEDEVPELAEQIFNHAQYPLVLPTGQGFPVVRID